MTDKPTCGRCGGELKWIKETLLCPKCDWETIYLMTVDWDRWNCT